MYYIYILLSESYKRYYIGSCDDINVRLARHNSKKVISTKAYTPWKLIYSESFESRGMARKRELQIKSYKGGEAFKDLIFRAGCRAVKCSRL